MTQEAAQTVDAFHRGGFWLIQPKRGGHRAGADALILAAAVPSDFSGMLADFGAGAGAAGLAVASRCANAEVTLVEQSPDMARYAELTLAHPQNAGLSAVARRCLSQTCRLAGAGTGKSRPCPQFVRFCDHEPAIQRGRRPRLAKCPEAAGARHGGRDVRRLDQECRGSRASERRPRDHCAAGLSGSPFWQRSTAVSALPKSCRFMPARTTPPYASSSGRAVHRADRSS